MVSSNGYNLTKGLQVPLIYVNDITNGLFIKLLLIVLFLGISLASYFSQVRRKGDANIFAVFTVVGLGIFIFMLMLSAVSGIIGFMDLTVAFILEAIFALIFFNTEREYY